MSRNINDIIVEVEKSNQEVNKPKSCPNELAKLSTDIEKLKEQTATISSKIDYIIDLLDALYFILEESELDEEDSVEDVSNEGWLPELDDWENGQE
jgi:hypothetical protein